MFEKKSKVELLAEKLNQTHGRHIQANRDESPLKFGDRLEKLRLNQLIPSKHQPRRRFAEKEIQELAESIKEVGLLQPVLVRPSGELYEILAGERRWLAHKHLNLETIQVIIRDASDYEMAAAALAENISRQDLTDYEICKALRRIEHSFQNKTRLAEAVGLNREDMYKYFSFEELPSEIQTTLDSRPELLARKAATDIRAVLKKDPEHAMPHLLEAWSMLEAGKIEQTKIAQYIKQRLEPQKEKSLPATHALMRAGKVVGNTQRTDKAVTVRIDAKAMTEDMEQKLVSFLEKLLADQA
ncbi:ParB/RepB/Spo0J family partition protein [Parachitinimonas caeni]|uniref:ParB/RepB/Spo0J family partition protein n=1 Tax=Parachitinimonas caeni TaxID=3031301 RepID=A0ABT7DZG9_9NEIS|nr:ParB/RepB/Spo0J family partition protein [Parachitinimonas caeni]MDK2125441.1 ParB/RepB/Spo0J family partition protein [Parachitinimonas caeni]